VERSQSGPGLVVGPGLEEGAGRGGEDDGDVSAELRRGRGGGYSNPIQTMCWTGRAGFLRLDRTGGQDPSPQLLESFAVENVVSVGLGLQCKGARVLDS